MNYSYAKVNFVAAPTRLLVTYSSS